MAFARVLIVIAIGSVIFHLLSPWWWTPIASNWRYIDDTIVITFWITGLVFVGVVLFMAYCIVRFRHRPGHRATYEPENTRLEGWLAAGTAIGVAAMLGPGLLVWHQFINVPEGAMEFEVVGQQWQWSYRLPGKDGKLGTSDVRFIGPDNPLGVNPDDPHGRDDIIIEAGDLHLPLGKPIHMLLRSIDVLHNFYVPEFRAKMDMIPGQVTYFWLTPTREGTFDVLCAEYCGMAHSSMRGTVIVEPESDFITWRQNQRTFAQLTPGAGTDGAPN